MIEWLESLKGGAPTVFGSLVGSSIGLVALVLGALFNAHLNRKRDDRLRRLETRSVAAAIRAELASIEATLRENAAGLRNNPPEDFVVPDIAHSVRMFPSLADRIGLLGDPSLITEVVGAYIVVDQYCENLVMAGGQLGGNIPGHRRVVGMSAARVDFVARMNETMAERTLNTMRMLDRFLD